jgi:hypothetical protein
MPNGKGRERFKGLLRRFKGLPEPKREKYLRFLFHIARLRPKRLNLLFEEVKQMPITIEVEKDPLYLKGVEKAKREDVIRLYKATQWNTKKIAEVLNVPEGKVKQWLREEGLLERSKS